MTNIEFNKKYLISPQAETELGKFNASRKPRLWPSSLFPTHLSPLALLVLLVCAFPFSAIAQQSALPWLESIGAQKGLADIHTISAEAAVTVSD